MSPDPSSNLTLNPESDVSLIAQLSQQLTWLIASGELGVGDKLPPMQDVGSGAGYSHAHCAPGIPTSGS